MGLLEIIYCVVEIEAINVKGGLLLRPPWIF